MPQIRQVVSEALQSTVRRLLPSQQGFTEDLMATNVITPIIDLTPTAEGSQLPSYLQTASSFDDVTAFSAIGGSDVVANTAGFWRIQYAVSFTSASATAAKCSFTMSDGLSTKSLLVFEWDASTAEPAGSNNGEFYVFLTSGDSISAVSTTSLGKLYGHAIQVADVNGVLSTPAGFSQQ